MKEHSAHIDCEVVYTNLGRIRIKIPRLKYNSEYGARLKELVESLEGVTDVWINQAASSLVVHCEAGAVSDEEQQAHLFNCIQQAASMPAEHQEPAHVEPAPQSERDSLTLAESKEFHAVAGEKEQQEDSEVTFSPLSEESLPAAGAPAATAETETPALVLQHLKQSDLAKRLGVRTQTLTNHRSKPDFAEWSRSQDPEGIAWRFEPASKSFYRE